MSDPDHGVQPAGLDIAGEVRPFSTPDWPSGYVYGATRYADVILRESFPDRYRDLVSALDGFNPTLEELRAGGGGRTVFVKRFDDSLAAMHADGEPVWGKQNVTIEKVIGLDGTPIRSSRTRGHEIDMFGKGADGVPLPGVAVEMEWNNKDPFYDRDLINFQALHREGAISVGVVVTRGPDLQALIGPTIRSKDGGYKYGQSTTHWNKLIPKVNLGGGGECPLLLVGIQPDRIIGISLARDVKAMLDEAQALEDDWRSHWATHSDARAGLKQLRDDARALMPPVKEASTEEP